MVIEKNMFQGGGGEKTVYMTALPRMKKTYKVCVDDESVCQSY